MYEVKFYRGDYYDRQHQANEDHCIGYIEHHFNSSDNPAAGYALVIVGSNASQTSKNWGRWYARAVANEFDIRIGGNDGILVGGWNGRGDYNLRFTDMPADPAPTTMTSYGIRKVSPPSCCAPPLREQYQRATMLAHFAVLLPGGEDEVVKTPIFAVDVGFGVGVAGHHI